jgi:hypothetical protein
LPNERVFAVRRSRLDLRHGCELFGCRRPDVLRLRDRLQELTAESDSIQLVGSCRAA